MDPQHRWIGRFKSMPGWFALGSKPSLNQLSNSIPTLLGWLKQPIPPGAASRVRCGLYHEHDAIRAVILLVRDPKLEGVLKETSVSSEIAVERQARTSSDLRSLPQLFAM
jgi:hypothetical protein